MISKKYTLITGASTGLGKALANECAKLNRNLILTALPGENINKIAEQLRNEFGVEVSWYETDFTRLDSVDELYAKLHGKFEIDMLINNAGIGGTKAFLEASPDYIDQIVLLNTRALVMLTRILLPVLRKQKKSYILNIASMASFGPMPYKTVYPASKAFVYSFSRGLNVELKGSGVSISVAHPGGMKTNPEVIRRIEKHNKLIQATTLEVEKVAKICVHQTLRGDQLIIPGFMNKLSWIILKLMPVCLRLNIMRNSLQNELHESNKIIAV